MSNGRNYSREKNGKRFVLSGGMDTVHPLDAISDGSYAYLQNVRRQLNGRISGRPTMGDPLFTLASAPDTIVRMNDTSPDGPVAGYVRLIATVAGGLYLNATQVASGLDGNPLAILPFGPDQSVQPWGYVGDASQAVTITATGQACTGMVKVRSDGLTYKTGIKEPQLSPQVGVNTSSITEYLSLPANTPPWTNIAGVNASYNYGGTDIQPPFPTVILTPIAGSKVVLTVTGTATVNGAAGTTPGALQPATANYPGAFITSPVTVIFAFTDANGNVLAQSTVAGAPPVVGNVGAGATLTVPTGASQLQLGIDSAGGTFHSNSGAYLVRAVVSTTSVSNVTALVGQVTAYIWGDSPHSGPVAEYIWKNPNDGSGAAIARTIGTAQATASNNSLILGSNAGGVQNDPQNITGPVQWTTLNPDGSVAGIIPLFDPALESEGYADFNCCIVGSIFFATGGTYAITIVNKDQVMFGMGGGITSDLGNPAGSQGQSETVASALPLLFVSVPDGEGGAHTTTFHLNVPALGVYQFEFDWDYWYHSGRQMQVTIAATPGGSPVTIPPLPSGARTNVEYWGKYRSSKTGAQSNPGPASPVEQTPVLANTVTMPFSTDPQVDKCDYYRQDQGLPNPTYVITGPNDGLGPVINGIQYNTPVTDTLTDLQAAANQIMQRDDYEPFPSIDTPKAGFVTIVDGVITWKSGDQFDVRWLPGTLMLIGAPSQNAYSLVARPISTTEIIIPDVPDTIGDAAGDGVPYNIAQPILAQQPLPSMWGPDAYGFMHACGDPNQPEAYVWTKAYNPDSAPQTNRLLLTSPSEALMGGGLINGISMVFSTLRAWLMYPNFADAQATTEGTTGTPWNPILAVTTRGLYIRNCLCSIGGKALAYRAPDGISITSGGGEQSITDAQLYNLFPHEGFTPQPVTIGPYTAYPPDDTQPQTLTYQNGYLYYNYLETTTIALPEEELASYAFTIVENPLSDSGNFTTVAGAQPVEVPSMGVAQSTMQGSLSAAIYTGISWPDDQYSEITILACGATNALCPIVVRSNGADTTYYFQLSGLSTNSLFAIVGGVEYNLGPLYMTQTTGDVIRLAVTTGVNSNIVSIYKNGVLQGLPFIDTVYYASLTSGTPGFGLIAQGLVPTNGATISKWAGGGAGMTTVTTARTLVFDEVAKGWSVDVYNPIVTTHGVDYAAAVSDTAVGCVDGSVRILQAAGTEVVTSAVATGADNAGDARALKRVGDVFVKALIETGNPVALAFYSAQYETVVAGLAPLSLTGAGTLAPYIVDGGGVAIDLIDLEMILSWPTGAGNELDLWQPVLMPLPAAILSRRTDGIAVGRGYQHVYLVNATFAATAPVTLTLNTDQGTFTQTWPASGTLAVLTRVMEKMPPNKFKVCEYQIASAQEFYLFDFEIWVGEWGRAGAYTIIRPFEGGGM
jgi:hypothetical protein